MVWLTMSASAMPDQPMPLVLPEDTARFLQSGLSIIVGSADGDGNPSLGRALACRVTARADAAQSMVELFLVSQKALELLDDLRRPAPIAVAFTQPSTHRTLQIKAPRADLTPLQAGDLDWIDRSQRDFIADVNRIMGGDQAELIRTALGAARDVDVRLVVWPTAWFEQTPGPRAGQILGGAHGSIVSVP
jgi:hypothetical protein